MNLKDITMDLLARLTESETAFTTLARKLLCEDLGNPDLNEQGGDPDSFGLRANEVGKYLIWDHHTQLASLLYKLLLRTTREWSESESKKQRHLGMFYANLGASLALMGDLDRACIAFWKAAAQDQDTYNASPEDTFALARMFQDYVVDPALQFVLKSVSDIDGRIGVDELRTLYKSLKTSRYAFAAYLHIASIHSSDPKAAHNEFSNLQKLNVLRSLTALLEAQLRSVTSARGATIWEMLEDLHDNQLIDWFDEFRDRAGRVGATQERRAGIDYQL